MFGASIVLGAQNVLANVKVFHRKQTTLNGAQMAASILQLMNQICFIVLFTQSATQLFGGNCRPFQDFADFCFFTYQILSSSVLILRATSLLADKTQRNTRIAFGVLLLASISFLAHSAIVKNSLIFGDSCGALYDRNTNTIGKVILITLYIALLGVFLVSAVKHIRSSKDVKTGYLWRVITSLSSRVTIAILGYLICAVLSFTGVWGNLFYAQFTIENYLGIVASTYSTPKEQPTNKTMGSTSLKNVSQVLKHSNPNLKDSQSERA